MSIHWDLSQLRTFLSIAETGSITETAKQLHLTQPAVSKRLQQLERHLNISLFDRINKQLIPTQAGHSLLPRAHELILNAQDIQRFASSLRSEVSGKLKIATSHHIGLRRLPPYLRDFRRSYRDVDLQIDFLDSETAIKGVLQGQYEIAIVTLPHNPPDSLTADHTKLLQTPLWADPMHFVVASGHPLLISNKTDTIELRHIANYPAVLPERDTHTYQIVATEFTQRNLPLTISMHNNYMENIRMLVSCGFGWSLLPGSMLLETEKPSLTILPTSLKLSRRLGFVTHQDRTLSPPALKIIKTLQ